MNKLENLKLLYIDKRRNYLVNPEKLPEKFSTDRGIYPKEEILNKNFGEKVGNNGYLLYPTLTEKIKKIKRNSQIMYPKELGFVLMELDIRPGSVVIESGCGSGAATITIATFIGEEGHLYSYEKRQRFIDLARENLIRYGLENRVTFYLQDAQEGFKEQADAILIDLPEPEPVVKHVYNALKPGKKVCFLLPTTTQIHRLLEELNNYNFINIRIVELFERWWNPNKKALRPQDNMIGHTAFLIFANKVVEENEEKD